MKKRFLYALSLCVTGLAAMAADVEKKAEAPQRNGLMDKYDKNKNGKLDEDEREALRKDRAAERVKRYDKNNDGKLDKQEEAAIRAEFRKRRGESDPAGEKKKDAPAQDAPTK